MIEVEDAVVIGELYILNPVYYPDHPATYSGPFEVKTFDSSIGPYTKVELTSHDSREYKPTWMPLYAFFCGRVLPANNTKK